MKNPTLILLLTLVAPWAVAINVCTDANGRRTYQDQACPMLPAKAENQARPAGDLTARIAGETVQRFHQTMSQRDIAAATGYLARSFRATIERPKGTSRPTRGEFAKMLTDVLGAASQYQSLATCDEPDGGQGEWLVRCEVREHLVLLSKTTEGNSTELYRVILEDGHARLAEIKSKQK